MSLNGKMGFGQDVDKSHPTFFICWSYFDLVHVPVLNVALALTAHLEMELETLKGH